MKPILATYCTGQKNNNITSQVPACKLYRSDRIDAVSNAAGNLDLPFYILSGKYGLIHSDEKIDFYDHMLSDEEVEKHANLIASQIKDNGISSILYFINSSKIDPLNKAYINCMKQAASITNISLTITEFNIFE